MDVPCPHPAIYDRGECCGKCPTLPQDRVSDVEREAAFLCARLREFEREGVTEDSFREWNGHVSPSLSRLEGLLAVPINKIGEDARTYADGVEDAAKVADAYAVEMRDKAKGSRDLLEQRMLEAHDYAGRNLASAIRRLSDARSERRA